MDYVFRFNLSEELIYIDGTEKKEVTNTRSDLMKREPRQNTEQEVPVVVQLR